MPKFDDTFLDPTFLDLDSPASVEVKQLIAKLEHTNDLQYELINMEAWSLASTMDGFFPGFWSRFLANRRNALKQFLQQKRTTKQSS